MSKKTFEQSLKQLEQIVEELESGDIPLEKALSRFEEGIKLSQACTAKLDEIEQKISILLKSPSGGLEERPFEPNDTD